MHKKRSFSLMVSSVNVATSAGNCELVTFTEAILDEKLFLQRLLKIILTLRDSRSLHKIRESTGFH